MHLTPHDYLDNVQRSECPAGGDPGGKQDVDAACVLPSVSEAKTFVQNPFVLKVLSKCAGLPCLGWSTAVKISSSP